MYPATIDLLAVQPMVTECGLPGGVCALAYQLRIFPHPANRDSAANENKQKQRRAGEKWESLFIRNAEPQPGCHCGL
jgi:hypothetical protein